MNIDLQLEMLHLMLGVMFNRCRWTDFLFIVLAMVSLTYYTNQWIDM